MEELKVHNDILGHPIDLHIDKATHPLAAYIFLGAIPGSPPHSMCLTYGNSEVIGAMMEDFFVRCVKEQPEMAFVLEQVARGIVGIAESSRQGWPGEGTGPITPM